MLSFVYVAIYWNNHHHFFNLVERVDGAILWANLHLLFWLSLIPFTTAWMGEHYRAVLPTAVVIGLAWEAAKFLYVLALPRLDFESVYGPFRVSVGLMMWAFLSGLMLLAGAHFSANRYALLQTREAEAEEKSSAAVAA